jgi:hypothetical protein
MEKIKNNFIWFFAAISLIVHFFPKGDVKEYINLALPIIITPFLILSIIKAFRENSKQANTRIITDFVFIFLVIIFGYLYKQSEF